MMATTQTKAGLLEEASQRLQRLSPERLRVANDFLAYLEEREQSEATEELLRIPGLERAFHRAEQQVKEGHLLPFEDIRRDV